MTTLPIKLLPGFYPVVKADDVVAVGQVIAKKDAKPDEVIDLTADLGMQAKDLPKIVQKNPGDHIEPGDILAIKKGLLGEKKVLSGIKGTILRFERDSGKLVVRRDEKAESSTAETMLSPLDGTIALCNNEAIHIKTDKNVCVGVHGIGGSAEAQLVQADGLSKAKSTDEVIPAELVAEQIGKIIVGGAFTREVLAKASAMGISGIIAGSIEETDLAYLNEKNMQLPIVVLDAEQLKKVEQWIGKSVYIDGKSKTILLLQYESKRT